jgi:hypothetical protein
VSRKKLSLSQPASVVDPHHLDADPDSTYHPDADSDSTYQPEKTRILILFDPDADPEFFS